MKYWLFERGDVVGPFPAEELTGREGFGPQSLVCPEDRGDDDTFWKEAQFYEDFAPAASPAPAEPDEKQASAVPEPAQPAEKKDVFDEELDSLLSENNPLAEADPSAGETAEKVHFPPHEPAKSGPIEDYFNNIQGGDLGNILGIPDPNENSDMNLARAFEKQFKQTEPPLQTQTPVQIESGPFDEFTAKEDLDDLTPGDGLAAVAPLNDNGAPVVLAEKPLPAEEKPKFRLRKKQEPKPGEDKTAPRAETQSAQEKPATGEHLQPVQAEPALAAVPGEKQTPAVQEPAGQIPADKKSAPEKASAEEPQPQAQKEETLTEEKQPAETQAPAEKAEEISPAGAADGETVLPEETQPQTQGAVSPVEQAEPAPALQTETTGAAEGAPLRAAQEVQPEPAPQAEPETEEMDSIPLSVAREPLALSVKNPDGLKETPAEETPAPANGPAETAEPEAQTRSPQEKPILDIQETAEEQTSQTAQEPEGNAPQSAPEAEKEISQSEQALQESAPQATQPPEETQPQEPEKESPQAAQVPAGEQTPAPAAQDPVEEIMSGAVEVNTAPEVPEPIKQVAPVVEPQVNRVKPKLKKTPEIEQFLTEKILPADEPPARRNKGVLWAGVLLVLLLLAGGFLLLLKPAATKPEPAPAAQPLTQSGGAVEELMPDAAVQPEVPTAQEALSLPGAPSAKAKASAPAAPAAPELNPVDTARQIVQNYNLPNFNGKVSDYFDRIYKDKLAQGYSATWSAERLHNNVYIVKYRLSKTRSEPVVYIFQVDVARNKLTGALNNITLDLVGKIK